MKEPGYGKLDPNWKGPYWVTRVGSRLRLMTPSRTLTQDIANLTLTGKAPYRVTHVGPNNTYHLEALDGKALPRPWNVLHLKKFYP
ncbi:hypothetical protein CK203_048870 [Vitis vinifera]|uniref:Uncharacterized protein n=1 Tax=Vitis vinifera TaxID=29760 RepID=A0A438FKX2_VITVI|nr:hypothetical protein CK203_048870 [Vitis vinifera]